MAGPRHSARAALGLVFLVLAARPARTLELKPTTLRWAEGTPGCTFSADDDGKYRYGFWTDDFGVIVAVDSQELQKSIRRTEPLLGVLITFRYRGHDSITIRPDAITLGFVKHEHDVQRALDPDALSLDLQHDADTAANEADRQIRKHPEKKAEQESQLQVLQTTVKDMQEFLRTRSLRSTTLDPAGPDVNGWVFFRARSKWIGKWNQQEEFLLKIPLSEQVIEFPFALPPSSGDLLLRRRP